MSCHRRGGIAIFCAIRFSSMKTSGAFLMLFMAGAASTALAIPQEVGITPLFGGMLPDERDLTEGFVNPRVWGGERVLPGDWSDRKEMGAWEVAHLERAPILFGYRPIGVEACYRGERLDRVSIYYLESGTYFGYAPELKRTQEGRRELQEKERLFKKAFKELNDNLAEKLETLTDDSGRWMSEGRTRLLQMRYRQFEHEDLALQLRAVEKHFIRVDLLRKEDVRESYLHPGLAETDRRERAAAVSEKVVKTEDGGVAITGVPLVPQGGRAYCGITTFLMAARYLGIQLDPATMASVSGFRYGMGGNKMIESYSAAAREGDVRLSRTTTFDFDKAKRAIDAGLPVLVWRKYDPDRDRLHRGRRGRSLPEPDAEDRATWPDMKRAPNHCSVITGYHPARRELIFSESWGENARDKRMRVEEMEATAYETFYFRL